MSVLLPKKAACQLGLYYKYWPDFYDSLDAYNDHFRTYDIDFVNSFKSEYIVVSDGGNTFPVDPVVDYAATRTNLTKSIAYLRMLFNHKTSGYSSGTAQVDYGMRFGYAGPGNDNNVYIGLQYINYFPNARIAVVPIVGNTIQSPLTYGSVYSDLACGNNISLEVKVTVNSLGAANYVNATIEVRAQGTGAVRTLTWTGNIPVGSSDIRPTWYTHENRDTYMNVRSRLYEFYWATNNSNLSESCEGDPPHAEVKAGDVSGNSAIYFPLPERGYHSQIIRPFDIVDKNDGKIEIYDAGSKYDKRICEADFVLNATEALDLADLLSNASEGRGQLINLFLPQDSDFYPFAPDSDPKGLYTVSVELLNAIAIGERPYKRFRTSLRFINAATLSPYTLPVEVDEGSLSIGTVQSLRFPAEWFAPDVEYAYHAAIEEGGDIQYVDRGTDADRYRTRTTLTCNTSKAGALIDYLQNARAGTFQIRTGIDMYIFGREKSGAGLYTVRILDDKIDIVHERHNQFKIDFGVEYFE